MAVEPLCLTESSIGQDFLLLTRRLAHGACSWPTRWTMTELCRVVNRTGIRSSSSTPIAHAKLKLSELFERDGIYGIE